MDEIIRVEQFDNVLSGSARLLDDCPGWGSLIAGLKARLQTISDSAKVTGAWSRSDGTLAVRLDGLSSVDHEQQTIRDAVTEAERAARRTCLRCSAPGSIRRLAGSEGEPFGYALCDDCALSKYMRDEMTFPPPAWTVLPEGTVAADIMVEPGWWELLGEFRAAATKYASIEWMYARQRGGHLELHIELPEGLDSETIEQVRTLASQFEQRSASLCEHCGDPGRLSDHPWTHVCCGECDAFEAEVVTGADA